MNPSNKSSKKENRNPEPVPIEEALRRIARAGPVQKKAKKTGKKNGQKPK